MAKIQALPIPSADFEVSFREKQQTLVSTAALKC
jgi:hypothetical protein